MTSLEKSRGLLLLSLLLLVVLPRKSQAQTWNFSAVTYETDEVPIFRIIKETLQNGYYDHGNDMRLKAQVFELGECSSGHPCALGSGLSWLYPDGCPVSQCLARWTGDPWRSYPWQCEDNISAASASANEAKYGNLTKLSNEFWEYFSPSCSLRYDFFADEYSHEKEGVAIVVKTSGFTFPAQTVLVLDIDSTDENRVGTRWPDVAQEVSTNFAVLGKTLVKPSNTYATDHFDIFDLLDSPPLLTQIKVNLTQELLDALGVPVSEDSVMGSAAGLTRSLVGDADEYYYPRWAEFVAGAMVWAQFDSAFDTLAYTMTLARKHSQDRTQSINLQPVQVRTRCRCSASTHLVHVMRRAGAAFSCTRHVASVAKYACDASGGSYCNVATATAWDQTGPERGDGTVACAPRNATRVVLEADVGAVGALGAGDFDSWPGALGGAVALPSATPNASPSASASGSP